MHHHSRQLGCTTLLFYCSLLYLLYLRYFSYIMHHMYQITHWTIIHSAYITAHLKAKGKCILMAKIVTLYLYLCLCLYLNLYLPLYLYLYCICTYGGCILMARAVSEMHTSTICCHQLRSWRSEGQRMKGAGGGRTVIIGAERGEERRKGWVRCENDC